MKKVLFLFVTMLIAISLVACGSEDEGAKKVEGNQEEPSAASDDSAEEEEEKEAPEDTVFKVGETVELNDAQITLTSASFVDAEEYTPAENGAVMAIEFEAKNNGEESLYIGSEEFTISTPDGTQHDEYFGKDDGFMNENISKGKKITGTIYFDVPEDEKYELIYEPTFTFDSNTITFEIAPQ